MRPKIIKHRGRWKSAEKIQSNRNDVGSLANKKHCHKMFCCCARWTENNRWSLQFPSTCAHPLYLSVVGSCVHWLRHRRKSWTTYAKVGSPSLSVLLTGSTLSLSKHIVISRLTTWESSALYISTAQEPFKTSALSKSSCSAFIIIHWHITNQQQCRTCEKIG